MKNIVLCLILFLALSASLTGCGPKKPVGFSEIEAALASNPDSVLAALEMIDVARLDAKTMAYRDLYLMRARQMCHMVLTDDSTAEACAEYFRHHGPDEELMKSLYYLGVAQNTNLNDREAMYSAENARRIAEDLQDEFWTAKCYELIADIFASGYNQLEAISAREEAARHYAHAGREGNHLFALADMALHYGNMGDVERGEELADSVLHLPAADAYPMLKWYCYRTLLICCSDRYPSARLEEIADSLRKYNVSGANDANESIILATARFRQGDIAGMLPLIDESMRYATHQGTWVRIYWLLLHYYERQGDLKMAMAMEDSILAVNNRQVEHIVTQSGLRVQHEMMRSEMAVQQNEARWHTRMWIVGVVAIVLLGAWASLWVSERMKRKNAELETLMEQVAQACSERDSRREDDERIREEIRRLAGDQWKTISNLCTGYRNETEGKNGRNIMRSLETEFEKLRTPAMRLRIEETVNAMKHNLAARLRAQSAGRLDKDEIDLAVLFFSGMSPVAISVVFGINRKTLYGRRERLRTAIMNLNMEDSSEFMSELG